MKRLLSVFSALALTVLMTSPVLAQGFPQDQGQPEGAVEAQGNLGEPGEAGMEATGQEQEQQGQLQEQGQSISDKQIISAEELSGIELYSQDNEKIGEIEGVAIDRQNGQIQNLIVSTGGVLGMGETYHLLSWDNVSFEQNRAVSQLSESEIKASPSRESLENLDEWAQEVNQQAF